MTSTLGVRLELFKEDTEYSEDIYILTREGESLLIRLLKKSSRTYEEELTTEVLSSLSRGLSSLKEIDDYSYGISTKTIRKILHLLDTGGFIRIL